MLRTYLSDGHQVTISWVYRQHPLVYIILVEDRPTAGTFLAIDARSRPLGPLIRLRMAVERAVIPRYRREPLTDEQRVALREQALVGLRHLQRDLERSLRMRNDAPRYLTRIGNRDRLNHSLDLLTRAGEAVPPWLYKRGPVYPGALRAPRAGHPVDAVSLASLLGKTREARDLFDTVETDAEEL